MSSHDRNAPCPCGSGKKYKRCCLAAEIAADTVPRNPHAEAYGELVGDILRFAKRDCGVTESDLVAAIPAHLLDEVSFPFWMDLLVFHAPVPKQAVAELYLSRPRRPERAELCRARLAAWTTLLHVRAIVPGKGFTATDVLTGESLEFLDRSASESLQPLLTVMATPYLHDGVMHVGTAHPFPLAPADADHVVKAIRKALGLRGRKPTTQAALRSWDSTLRIALTWSELATAARERPEPKLRNTDGDPMVLAKDHFRFEEAQRATLIERLSSLEGAHVEEHPEEGTVIRFLRAPRERHATLENVLAGRLVLGEPGRAVLETNSERRANEVRAEIETACQGLLRHVSRELSDPFALIERARERGEASSAPTLPPEVAVSIIRDFKSRHYAAWPDEPLPALGSMTPREAARGTPAQRRKLAVLLDEMEYGESRVPVQEQYDIGILRAELGMPR